MFLTPKHKSLGGNKRFYYGRDLGTKRAVVLHTYGHIREKEKTLVEELPLKHQYTKCFGNVIKEVLLKLDGVVTVDNRPSTD